MAWQAALRRANRTYCRARTGVAGKLETREKLTPQQASLTSAANKGHSAEAGDVVAHEGCGLS
jgi:hypothetical protein